MLTSTAGSDKTIKDSLYQFIEDPLFKTNHSLWIKEDQSKDKICKIIDKVKEEKIEFYKVGKMLGFKAVRYCLYDDRTLYCYYEKQNTGYYGYCNVKNLYLSYIQKQQECIIRFSNGNQSCQMHFSERKYFQKLKSKLILDAIQFNFYQKYEVLNEIGYGSSAKVFKCRRKLTSQIFALKRISKKQQSTISTFDMVKSQKNILSQLKSQYIYHLQEFFQCNQYFMMVLQIVEGINLKQISYSQNSEIHYEEKVQILRQTLEALKACHAKKIIHRDIKPQNLIYLPQKKQIKLIDFGLALDCSKVTETSDFIRCGSFGYMAPQVIKNHGNIKCRYDYKCDIYSFGLIAHQLLLGNNPLIGKTYQQTYCKNRQNKNLQLNKIQINYKFGKNCLNFLNGLLENDPKVRISAQKGLLMKFFLQKQTSESTQQNDHKFQDYQCSSEKYHFDDDELKEHTPKLPSLPLLKSFISSKQAKQQNIQQPIKKFTIQFN